MKPVVLVAHTPPQTLAPIHVQVQVKKLLPQLQPHFEIVWSGTSPSITQVYWLQQSMGPPGNLLDHLAYPNIRG